MPAAACSIRSWKRGFSCWNLSRPHRRAAPRGPERWSVQYRTSTLSGEIGRSSAITANAPSVADPSSAALTRLEVTSARPATAAAPPTPSPNRLTNPNTPRRETRKPEPIRRPVTGILPSLAIPINLTYGYTCSRTYGRGPSYLDRCSTPHAWHASSAAAPKAPSPSSPATPCIRRRDIRRSELIISFRTEVCGSTGVCKRTDASRSSPNIGVFAHTKGCKATSSPWDRTVVSGPSAHSKLRLQTGVANPPRIAVPELLLCPQ